MIKKEYEKNLEEGLKKYLPEWQLSFCKSPTYKELCNALRKVGNDPSEENRSALLHAKIIWDDLCEKDPESIRQKENLEIKNIALRKNNHYINLLAKHKQKILDEK